MIVVDEDRTCVISMVKYDYETDWLVGFVLPCDQTGKPLCDSFVAVSFKSMEKCFHSADIAKYTFIYMVQTLAEDVPAFFLCCMGTNSKFVAKHVLKGWTHLGMKEARNYTAQLWS